MDQKQFDSICNQIANSSQGLSTICTDLHVSRQTFYDFMDETGKSNQDTYARAKQDQADFMADEMIRIADLAEDSNKARLQVDTRKWVASKLKPKSYGDHQQIEIISSVNKFVESTIKILKDYIPADKQAEAIAKLQASIDFND